MVRTTVLGAHLHSKPSQPVRPAVLIVLFVWRFLAIPAISISLVYLVRTRLPNLLVHMTFKHDEIYLRLKNSIPSGSGPYARLCPLPRSRRSARPRPSLSPLPPPTHI
jgi:hypothetical protein